MVAEQTAIAKPRSKSLSAGNACTTWTLMRELAAETMYLVDGLPPRAIAAALSTPERIISRSAVTSLISRKGWTQKRRQQSQKSANIAHKRAQEHVEMVVQAQGSLAAAASVQGLKRAMEAAESSGEDSARDFRSWAGGARDLVNIMRQARGLVDPGKAQSSGDDARTVNLSFFVGALTSADRAQGMKCVGPVLECEAVSAPAPSPKAIAPIAAQPTLAG
jgi:hypothetical protein